MVVRRTLLTASAVVLSTMVFTPSSMASYASYIARSKPVGWWGMNEAGGPALQTTADLSGAYGAAHNQAGVNLPLTYQGAGTASLTDQDGFVSGRGNRAAYFDGSSNSGAYGHGAVPYDLAVAGAIYRYEPGGFSAEAWIKRDGNSGSADSERVFSTREISFGFQLGGDLHFTTVAVQDYHYGGVVPNDGQWHQIGFSFDGNVTTSFYIDGLPAGITVGTNPGIRPALSPGANTINLTHRNTDTQHFRGYVDELVIWGHPRTAKDFWDSHEAALGASLGAPVLIIR